MGRSYQRRSGKVVEGPTRLEDLDVIGCLPDGQHVGPGRVRGAVLKANACPQLTPSYFLSSPTGVAGPGHLTVAGRGVVGWVGNGGRRPLVPAAADRLRPRVAPSTRWVPRFRLWPPWRRQPQRRPSSAFGPIPKWRSEYHRSWLSPLPCTEPRPASRRPPLWKSAGVRVFAFLCSMWRRCGPLCPIS